MCNRNAMDNPQVHLNSQFVDLHMEHQVTDPGMISVSVVTSLTKFRTLINSRGSLIPFILTRNLVRLRIFKLLFFFGSSLRFLLVSHPFLLHIHIIVLPTLKWWLKSLHHQWPLELSLSDPYHYSCFRLISPQFFLNLFLLTANTHTCPEGSGGRYVTWHTECQLILS